MTHVAVQATPAQQPHERRDLVRRDVTLQRVRQEFQEIPGLCVTIVQAARLFGLPHDVCGRVLSELAAQRVIQQSGRYYGALRTDFVGALFIHSTEREYR